MFYLSIDVESSGPFPGLHDLVSIGAVVVCEDRGAWLVDETRSFYMELQSQGGEILAEETSVHGLSSERLREQGSPAAEVMQALDAWCAEQVEALGRYRVAAWPVSFHGPFVGWMAQKHLGHNPLGRSGFDIASFGMGLFACTDREQLEFRMAMAGFEPATNMDMNHALADAVVQAHTLAWLLNHAECAQMEG
jgi:hypothetical protein